MADTKEMAMRRRLNALLRKTTLPESATHGESLVNLLVTHIRTKAEYEALLGEGDGAEVFARRNGLVPEHEKLLLELQRVKDIFVPNPTLDNILTIIFLLEVGAVLYLMNQTGYFATFIALLFAIDAIVYRVMDVSRRWGHGISSWLVRGGWVEEDPLAGKIQTKKWQEQSWQLFVHVSFTVIELMILSGEGYAWWADPRFCWIPHPRDQGPLHSPLLRFFYMAQLGVWMYTCFVHRFVDERRKDYFVMYLHHVVTICLVGVSWALDYWRIGLIVVFIHDISDIFVDSLKLINYLKLEGPRGWYGSEIAYVSCVLSWMYWRLWEYPFRVIKGAYYDTWEMMSSYPASSTVYAIRVLMSDKSLPLSSPPDLPMLVEMNVLLFVLLGLHIYWFHLFVMIGYRILTESAREASRQEYEGDSDDGLGGGTQGKDSLADVLAEAVPDEVGEGSGSTSSSGGQGGAKRRNTTQGKAS